MQRLLAAAGDWLQNLPVIWMALAVFAITYLVTAGILGDLGGVISGAIYIK